MQNVVWRCSRARSSGGAARRGSARTRRAHRADADCSYRLAMFVMRREQGRLEEMEGLVRVAVEAYPGYRSCGCFVPLFELELGRAAEARSGFDALGARRVRGCLATPSGCSVRARGGSVGTGRSRSATAVLSGLLAPYSRICAMAAGEVSLGPVVHLLGILAAATGRANNEVRSVRGRARGSRGGRAPGPWLAPPRRTTPGCCTSAAVPATRRGRTSCSRPVRATYRELGIAHSAR